MALARPLYMQPAAGDPAISYTAQQDRGGLLGSVFSREGVLDVDAGQLQVTQRAAGANFSVDIAPGRAAIFGDDVSDQGAYLVQNTTIYNLATPAAPGSGTRTHRLVARVRDKLHNGSWSVYDWALQILQDTGSGTPAEPASAITLALITMSAGMSSVTNANITDVRPRATVGTPDRAGAWGSSFPAGWGFQQPSRPLTWRINSEGWVSLAGWVLRTGPNVSYTANAQTNEAVDLPQAIRPASDYRDFIGITQMGPAHWAVTPAGELKIRFQQNQTAVQNVAWFSFDGCGYRL